MAATITVVCPECGKSIQAPADFVGKKVRCKNCSHVFKAAAAAPAGTVARSPAKAAKSTATPAVKPVSKPPVDDDEEGDDGNPYGVTTLDLTPRCPECAHELDSEKAVVCLNCGYNTITRVRAKTVKVHDTTAFDYFIWLLPGVACALAVLLMIATDIVYCLKMSEWTKDAWYEFTSSAPIKFWFCLISVFFIWIAAKFAFKRLILHPVPPEIERY